MKSGLKVTGINEVQKNLKAIEKKFGKEIMDTAMQAGFLVQSEAKRSILEVSHGYVETRYHASGNAYEHVVSASGDPPNKDQGTLSDSIAVEVNPDNVYVGTSVDYGKDLEYGNHPWLWPALEKMRPKILSLFRKNCKKIFKGKLAGGEP